MAEIGQARAQALACCWIGIVWGRIWASRLPFGPVRRQIRDLCLKAGYGLAQFRLFGRKDVRLIQWH